MEKFPQKKGDFVFIFFIKERNCDILSRVELNLLKNRRVLILGLGREGESSFRFLRKKFPSKILGLADELSPDKLPKTIKKLIRSDKNIKLYSGENYLESLKDYDVIVKTPGIPERILRPYFSEKQIITSQTDIFLQRYRNQTIGVTGTKGKGTTVSLIYKILKDNGLRADLVGNIGNPALSYFGNGKRKDLFVFEMSSHQLNKQKLSPHVAVFLNIHKAHPDHFGSFKKYFDAKKNIARWQRKDDYFVYNSEFPELKKMAKESKAKKITFGKSGKNDCRFTKDTIYLQKEAGIKRNEIPLQGKHFVYDVMAATVVASIFKIPLKKIRESVIHFKSPPHCLEYMGRFKGIDFYNDTFATEPIAAISALDALDNIETVILGGFDRGLDFTPLAKAVIKNRVKRVILFPSAGERIWQTILKQKPKKLPERITAKNMRMAVQSCFRHTGRGKICLLSPGCASFGIFENYKDRGEQFKKYVKLLGKK